MKILLLSAYDAQSHQAWHQQISQQLQEYDWTKLTLPPRYFNWRIRGNSLSWAFMNRDILSQAYDLVLATSMTDLTSLRSFIPSLTQIPNYLYFHENQFEYPTNHHKTAMLDPKIVSLYAALSADTLFFNSHFNKDSFLSGAQSLLAKMPDYVPTNLIQQMDKKSHVLPVPLSEALFIKKPREALKKNKTITLLWNHRWEYDKGPDRLYALLKELKKTRLPFRIHIVGQQFRQQPKEFNLIQQEFSENILSWGYINDKKQYQQVLLNSDIVLSTAIHDFQGLSLLEATAMGCTPLVPSRLAYPEWIPSEYQYESHLSDINKEAKGAIQRILELSENLSIAPDLSHLGWTQLSSQYRFHIERAKHHRLDANLL